MFPSRNISAALPRASLQLLQDGARCHECPLARNGVPSRPVPSEYFGREPPAVALVGEAPGRREVQMGRPFVGPSGKLLDYACGKANVIRGEVAILNAAACGPIPSERDDLKEQATSACRQRLLAELERLRPGVVMALGANALRVLGAPGIGGVTTVRGSLLTFADDVIESFKRQPHSEATGNALQGGSPWQALHGGSVTGSLSGGSSVPAHAEAMGLASPYFMATFHPAHILRGGDGEADQPGGDQVGSAVDLLFYFFMYDLGKAQRLARGQIAPWRDELDLFLLTHGELTRADEERTPATEQEFVDAVERVHAEARELGEYSIDVETDGKDALRCNLTAIAVSTIHGGLSATWAAWQAMPRALEALRKLLASLLRCIIQNRIFDSIVLPRHALPIAGPIDDTLLQHHAAFPGLPHKLDQIATQFFVVPPWKAEFRRGEKDEASLVLYNGRDALVTARLKPALTRIIEAHKTARVYEADRQQFAVATHMRKVGYHVDRVEQARQSKIQHERLNYMREQLAREFADIEPAWRNALARILAQKQRKKDPDSYLERVDMRWREIAERDKKPTDIGLFKVKAKADLVALFEVLRIPITDYTAKGLPVTNKKAMDAAAGRHPLMRNLIHIRDAQNMLAGFIDGLPIMPDGRVHPDWTPKITGRWGAGKAQNWPKFMQGWPPEKNEYGEFKRRPSGDLICPRENPRAIVTAPTAKEILALPLTAMDPTIRMRALLGKGRMLVGADFAQLELRIAGYLARDAFLIDIFNRGLDPHREFAAVCFGEKFLDAEREFYAICESIGVKLKPKADLSKAPLDDITRRRLAVPHAVWNRLRDLSKNVEYAGVYGGSADGSIYERTVALFPEVQRAGLQAAIDKVNSTMTGVVRWRKEREVDARVKREVRETLLGRVRLFPLGNFNPSIVYNFPIQAFGASLLARGIFRFTSLTHPELLQFGDLYKQGLLDASWVEERRAEGYGEWLAPVDILLNGHDSLLVECDEEDAERACKFLETSMTQTLSMGIEGSMTFPAEAAIGRRWSDT